MGSEGSAWLKMESRGNPPQNQRGLQIQPQKQEGSKLTPKPEWSKVRGERGRQETGKDQSGFVAPWAPN